MPQQMSGHEVTSCLDKDAKQAFEKEASRQHSMPSLAQAGVACAVIQLTGPALDAKNVGTLEIWPFQRPLFDRQNAAFKPGMLECPDIVTNTERQSTLEVEHGLQPAKSQAVVSLSQQFDCIMISCEGARIVWRLLFSAPSATCRGSQR